MFRFGVEGGGHMFGTTDDILVVIVADEEYLMGR